MARNGRPIYICAAAGSAASTSEAEHTVAIWQSAGFEVRNPPQPGETPGIVVGYCAPRFYENAAAWRKEGHRLVNVGCMNWLQPAERKAGAPVCDRYVFQSRFQRDALLPRYLKPRPCAGTRRSDSWGV